MEWASRRNIYILEDSKESPAGIQTLWGVESAQGYRMGMTPSGCPVSLCMCMCVSGVGGGGGQGDGGW